MKQILARRPRIDGLFCYNDAAALGAMRAISEAGLRVPEDIAVVGCGNLMYDEHLRVPLTSIDQDAKTLGVEAARICRELISARQGGKRASRLEVLLPPRLVRRASTEVKRTT